MANPALGEENRQYYVEEQLMLKIMFFFRLAATIICLCLSGNHLELADKPTDQNVSSRSSLSKNRSSKPYEQCSLHSFPCNNNELCVEQRFNCDGKPDCPDGSDEWKCEDWLRSQLWDDMFSKRPDEDREKKTASCVFQEITNSCRCHANHLFCEHQHLLSVPKPLPPVVTLLDLSGNYFPLLKATDFPQLPKLTSLIMKTSGVIVLEKDIFRHLPQLRQVHLSGNDISHLMNNTFLSSSALTNLDLSYNPLQEISSGAFQGLSSLRRLDLRECKLKYLTSGVFNPLTSLNQLWIDGNELQQLQPNTFRNLSSLKTLNLAHNRIRKLKGTAFGNMLFLLHLDLAYNSLEIIEEGAFAELSQLESLTLRGNSLRQLSSRTFEKLTKLTHIYFDEFYMCQFAIEVRVCEPRGDGISSVANLLDNIVLRVSVWIVAVLACCGNVFVLMSRLLLREHNAVHSFYIMNLSVADLLMGIYLFIIAGYDVSYRGHYILHEKQWRHSWKCNLCGLLSTLSSEASVLILTVITIDRYISVLHPISVVEKRRTVKSAFACMATVWSVAVMMSALPLSNIAYYGLEFYGNNGVCLPLHIHNPFSQAWEYSTFLFCGLNTVAFVFILYAYVSMFFTISASKIGLRSTQQQQDRTIAKRFAFIVSTDFLCWIPVVLIKLIALGGIEVDKTLYAWIAVFLLPVNSALNPILYTLTTTVFKQQLSRILINCRSSRPLGKNVDSSGTTSSTTANRRNPKRAVLVVFSEVDHSYHNKSSFISASRHSCTQKHQTSMCSKARRESYQDEQAV
ncbi:uncharacterized protein LOC143251282 [Tachypleus tridentatus]|uniref:uncharacterized protein LOC143251282 n=1 Tax=Tachypleus tridentatus TaxID=6853 RepID=UPI003FCF12B3